MPGVGALSGCQFEFADYRSAGRKSRFASSGIRKAGDLYLRDSIRRAGAERNAGFPALVRRRLRSEISKWDAGAQRAAAITLVERRIARQYSSLAIQRA
jgi:hypothetical protein